MGIVHPDSHLYLFCAQEMREPEILRLKSGTLNNVAVGVMKGSAGGPPNWVVVGFIPVQE